MAKALSIEDVRLRLEANGIALVSAQYSGVYTKHDLSCTSCEHKWSSNLAKYLYDRGCPACGVHDRAVKQRLSQQQITIRLQTRGIELLDEYVNARTKYRFRCSKGHIWKTIAGSVFNNGAGCPLCLGRAKPELLGSNSTPEERFWFYVDKKGPKQSHMSSRCWVWTGSLNDSGSGYGVFWVEGKKVSSHRYSLELHKEKQLENYALHKCDHKPCVRPSHLYDGTPRENARDWVERGRK